MAEENEIPFSPLDSLGPQFGNIDQVNSNPAAYENWENRGSIMDSDFNVPIAPNPGINQPQIEIRKDVVGEPDQRPPIDNVPTYDQILKSQQKLTASLATRVDRNDKNQIYAYNDGPNGDAFYDRYAAYGPDYMEDIGFHPFRDNESIYNDRTTGWNDFSRMMSNSFLPLVGRGFISGPKSLYRIVTDWDFSEDKEDAKVYERAAAIGQSSRGGLGAFMNNTMMNFGYTAGIITEAIVEEAALVALAPTTFGGSLLGTGLVGAKTIKGVGTAIDVADNVNKTLKAVDNYQTAKSFWTGTSLGRFINPLENTVEAVQNINKAGNVGKLARAQKTFGGFYRDVRNINMSLAEARLEGGFVANQVQDKLYEDYYDANGVVPDNDMQYDFAKQAKKAATESMIWNTGLIYGTNKIVFPNVMRPRGGIKNFLSSKVDDIKTLKDGKIVYRKAKDGAKGQFEYVENSFKNTVKSFWKDPFRQSLKGGLTYFKGNLMEGIQEVAQEVIAEATEGYYIDAFKQKNRQAFHYGEGVLDHAVKSEYFADALSNQFGSQGFETFASGFFMGMFARPFNAAIPALSTGYNKYFGDQQTYNKYKELRANYGQAAAQSLNNLYADPAKFFDSRLFNYSVQNSLSKEGNDGTTKVIADANDMAIIQQVVTSLEHNTFDIFVDHIESFKTMSAEEFEQAFGFQKGTGLSYKQKIDAVVEQSKRIKNRYEFYKERFPNPIDLKRYKDKDSLEYTSAALLKKAWDISVNQAVFFNESFENVSARLVEISNDLTANSPLKNISSTDVQVLLNDTTANSKLELLKNELKSIKDLEGTEDRTRQLESKISTLEKLVEAKSRYKKYTYPERYDEQFIQEIQEKVAQPGGVDVEKLSKEDILKFKEQFYGSRTPENDKAELDNLKDAYVEYLDSIKEEGDTILMSKVEDSFERLIDYYTLQDEAETYVYYTNILHNPEGFIDQVKQNEKWMTKMYENRSDYFIDMVQSAMKDREHNAILNALADENVFLDPEAFKSFMSEGIEPEEFFDNSTKQVISKGTQRYKYYLAQLYKARELSNEQDIEDIEEASSLTAKIKIINDRRERELSYLKGEEVEEKTGVIIPNNRRPSFKISKIIKDSKPGDRIVAKVSKSKSNEQIEFVNIDGQLYDENNELVDSESLRKMNSKYPSFSSADIYTTTIKQNQKQVDLINEKFDRIIKSVTENFSELQKEDAQDYINNPTRDKLKLLDRNLYNKIQSLFEADEDYAAELKEAADDIQRDNLFNQFVKENPEARKLIQQFFNKSEIDVEVESEDQIKQSKIERLEREINNLESKTETTKIETKDVEIRYGRSADRGDYILQNVIVSYKGEDITGQSSKTGEATEDLGNYSEAGKEGGHLYFIMPKNSNDAYVGSISIPENLRGKGVASKIYQALASHSNRTIKDSSKYESIEGGQSEAGKGIWKNRDSFKPQTETKETTTPVKKGVSKIFKENTELSEIGTEEQYSEYLNSVFPESKIKDIVYHSTDAEFKEFDPSKAGSRVRGAGAAKTDKGAFGSGMYFTPNSKYTKVYGKNTHAVILNIENPKTIINNEGDNTLYTGKTINELWGKDIDGVIQKVTDWNKFLYEGNPHGTLKDFQSVGLGFKPEIIDVVVRDSEQIHVIGSQKDIEGFKEFVNKTTTPETNEQEILNKKKQELKKLKEEVSEKVEEQREEVKENQILKGLNKNQKEKVNNFIDRINSAQNVNELNIINGDIFNASDIGGLSSNQIDINTANKLYKLSEQKSRELIKSGIKGVSPLSIKIGDSIQVINPNGTKITPSKGISIILSNGTTVKVVKKSKNSVTLNAGIGENSQEYQISNKQLEKDYGQVTPITEVTDTTEKKMTDKEKKHIEKSETETMDLLSNKEAKEKLRKEAEDQGINDATDELMDDINCG